MTLPALHPKEGPFAQLPWKGLPYYPISQYYQKQFGGRAYKISVSVMDSCPNRDGLKGMKTCIFCDPWGSAAYAKNRDLNLKEQIIKTRRLLKAMRAKYCDHFLVYFQSYTNSYAGIQKFRDWFDTALSFEDTCGIVVGTRPDCLSPKLLELWQEYHEKRYLSVELGVQSFINEHLEFIRRGHTAEKSIEAILKIKKQTSINLGIHLMFGMPNETEKEIIETAHLVSSLPIDNVKLHNTHVLKNTPLENLYNSGKFQPISLEEYAKRVRLFLTHLRKDIAVQRLSAVASRWDELVAPQWTRHKMASYNFILQEMAKSGSFQGQNYSSQHMDSQDQIPKLRSKPTYINSEPTSYST